ncbi:MAG TPA: DNA repair protein RecO, partial [Acidimicrobiales bacterium]|nr:DNA repair protein RecO [Acidimicrobiales bacterium]
MSLYRDEGVVLRTMRLGEADRIVTLMTKGHGKVRAVAKGVRRTTSKFGGRLEPLSHVTLLCWQGRELDIVNQAEVTDAFRTVREDLARMAKAFTVLEVVDQLAQERHANARLYDMLVGALRALEADDAP